MGPRQSTIGEIIESERTLILEAPDRYGDYYRHALDTTIFLSHCVRSADITRQIFVRFLSQVKKHHTLALFSTVRLHKVQSWMNLRQVLEAAACAAYAIANPDPADFVDTNEQGLLDPSQTLTNKRYKWLDANFPTESAVIKNLKDHINKSASHANLIITDQNYSFLDDQDWAGAPFFDIDDDHFVKIDLWLIGNIAIGITDLFYHVIQTQGGVTLVENFTAVHQRLVLQGQHLRNQVLATDRYKKAMTLARDK